MLDVVDCADKFKSCLKSGNSEDSQAGVTSCYDDGSGCGRRQCCSQSRHAMLWLNRVEDAQGFKPNTDVPAQKVIALLGQSILSVA